MDYTEFKTYLATFLWKSNDAELVANLDSLITMANAALSRDLRHERRHTSTVLSVTAVDTPLPDDYYSMRSVVDATTMNGEFLYEEPAVIIASRNNNSSSSMWQPIYSLKDKTLMLVGPASATTPFDVAVYYRAKIPDFKATDTSWVADDLLDLYVYGVLKHSAPFLREDERVGLWSNMYTEAIMQSNEDSAHSKTIGQYSSKLPSRQAGVLRRGDRGNGRLYR